MKTGYKLPTMKEIAEIKPNGFDVASTFSGCGGSSLGYRMAGFRVLWANEFVPEAAKTYSANFPKTRIDIRDIRKIRPEEILEATGKKIGELDLFDGSPPCASFSTAGAREDGWGKVKKYSDVSQRTDDLFLEYARLLEGLMPKTFVAENVSGLVKGVAKGWFKDILELLRSKGYSVKASLLDSKWLGVPQGRSRLIFVGVRSDLGIEPEFPKPLSFKVSITEALAGLDAEVEPESSIEGTAIGREWVNLKPGERSRKYFNLVKADFSKPSPTICASHGSRGVASVVHSTEKRKFSE